MTQSKKKNALPETDTQNNVAETKQPCRLYLMRHGKACKSGKKNKDVLRPLVKRGRKDVKKIGKLMKKKNMQPDLILCSPTVRAMETLNELKKAFNPAPVVFIDSLYTADAEMLEDVLRRTEPDKRNVLVIGHNPALEDFVEQSCLSSDMPPACDNAGKKFPTAALACMEIDDSWKNMGRSTVKLTEFVCSENL